MSLKEHIFLFGKAVPTILVFVLIIIGVTVSAASIVYFVTKPAEITIAPHGTASNYEIKLYENEACTEELTKFSFPVAKGGDIVRVFFYIKNLSDGNVTVDATFEGDVPDGATGFGFMGEHYSKGYIELDEVAKAEVYIRPVYDVEPRNYGFDITVNVYPY
jgi:hypothetical protein